MAVFTWARISSKDISERDSALSWFESQILAHVNAKLFQIRLLKREKRGILDRDPT